MPTDGFNSAFKGLNRVSSFVKQGTQLTNPVCPPAYCYSKTNGSGLINILERKLHVADVKRKSWVPTSQWTLLVCILWSSHV